MIRKVEGVIGEDGVVRLLETVRLSSERRALVMILDEEPAMRANDTALLSDPALNGDWSRPEEDAAWFHLQRER